MPAWWAIDSSTCRVSDPVKCPPMRWYSCPSGSPECTRYGRPDTSTTASARASSSGTVASPKRPMPTLSPSATRSASPIVIATSSTVWCASMWVSPVATTLRSMSECLPSAVSMWS